MRFSTIILLIALGTTICHSQSDLKRFPFINDDTKHYNAEIVSFSPGEIYVVWSKYEFTGRANFFMHKSTDDGVTWTSLGIVFDTLVAGMTEDPYKGATLIKGANNRLLLFIKMGYDWSTIFKYSDDGGITWSANRMLNLLGPPIFYPDDSRLSSAIYQGNGKILIYTQKRTSLSNRSTVSTDNGNSWSSPSILPSSFLENPSLLVTGTTSFYMVGEQKQMLQPKEIWFVKNNTASWFDSALVYSHPVDILLSPRLTRTSDNSLIVVFTRKQKVFNRYDISTTWYCRSTNEGAAWSEPVQLTRHKGIEGNLNLNGQSVKPLFTVSGDRGAESGSKYLYWGNAETLADTAAPPRIYGYTTSKDTIRPGDSIGVKLYTGEGSPIISVAFRGTLNGNAISFPLYDDGLHNDSLAGDKIYGNTIIIGDYYDFLKGKFFVASRYDTVSTAEVLFMPAVPGVVQTEVLKTGRLIVPFNSSGEVGDVSSPYGTQVRFDSIPVIASQGFLLSGYFNSRVWAAGTTSAFLFKDFQSGTVDYPSDDPRRGIYRIARADSAFGTSWKYWKIAVSMGARYWDGDGNGFYDPIDRNSNGTWEPNEDMPEILGEVSYFTVYNDGVSAGLRKFSENPQGIEVRQTLYTFPSSTSEEIKNAVFLRYEIVNRSATGLPVTDFIFSVQQDPDLGDTIDDMLYTDTLHNSVVAYNDGDDSQFGANPPAVYNTLLFGEPVTIPGVSFQDMNNNNIWDPGIDIALDTAAIPLGYPFEPQLYPGAINSQMASSIPYMNEHPAQRLPKNSAEARFFSEGKNLNGDFLEPCTWAFGAVKGPVSCLTVNPVFIYSGNPVPGNSGWIGNTPTDAMAGLASTTKTLEPGALFTYHTAIVVQRGSSALNSVTLTRAAIDTIFKRFGAAYVHIPTSVKEENAEIPLTWELSQNFPNPFNPSTIIRYSLPFAGFTEIKVYDITGALLRVLVSKELPTGKHEVVFDAAGLASGIYFYRLETAGYSVSKKMVLLR